MYCAANLGPSSPLLQPLCVRIALWRSEPCKPADPANPTWDYCTAAPKAERAVNFCRPEAAMRLYANSIPGFAAGIGGFLQKYLETRLIPFSDLFKICATEYMITAVLFTLVFKLQRRRRVQ